MCWRLLPHAPLGTLRTRVGWRILLGLSLTACLAGASGKALPLSLSDRVAEADDYYLGRQNPENLAKGLELLRADVAENARDFEAWWRISKFLYYQARHTSGPDKFKLLDEGVDAARKAIGLDPNRAEGHYWLGANYDLTSEARGYWRGLLFLDDIRKEMETANGFDPNYEEGGALRTIARLDYRAPFFEGGDKRLSIQLLKECLERFPENSRAMLYLSDSYLARGLRKEAREELEAILNLCPDPQVAPELAENQEKARARLARYFSAKP
ncbi:MAG TPA: tetratricopeptide repeat protein [Terriglobia bacterium]|nr:tetratricopeptide repeat protein [Terriglobia bacterium]